VSRTPNWAGGVSRTRVAALCTSARVEASVARPPKPWNSAFAGKAPFFGAVAGPVSGMALIPRRLQIFDQPCPDCPHIPSGHRRHRIRRHGVMATAREVAVATAPCVRIS
jgi:hypothetical protein